MHGLRLEHADHVAEVNEGVIDVESIHLARVKASLVTRHPKKPNLLPPPAASPLLGEASMVQGDALVCHTSGAGSQDPRELLFFSIARHTVTFH